MICALAYAVHPVIVSQAIHTLQSQDVLSPEIEGCGL